MTPPSGPQIAVSAVETPASRTSGLDRLIHRLALLITVVMLMISPMALNAIGWNYDGTGGSGPTRFHPATYLTVLLFLVMLLRDGNPLASLIGAFGHDLRITLFLVIWLIVFVHGTTNQQLPAASLIDTFLLPMLLLIMFARLEPATKNTMARLIHFAFTVNALLGLGEFLTGLRLTPYVAGGVAITDDWRSTALLGHPLGNALLTGCYATILLLGGGQHLKGWVRLAMIGLQFAAMVAFGGRASLVLLVLFGAIALARAGFLFVAGKRLLLRQFMLLAITVPLLLGAIGGLYEFGFFDKFILRFIEDKGSAEARIVMFELFRGFTLPELLFGPPQAQLGYFVQVYRLEFGIESLWIAFSLYYGILPAILFFTGLLFFILALMDRCLARGWVIIAYFFVVNSTFLGIAGKTISFANLCLVLLLLLPKRAPRLAAASSGAYQAALPKGQVPC
ncbi:MAG: hypothetical protein FD175_2129 [Beijerinckiaceae bacterium]|nr:MAG: hypothetical protein FD175_2129 [Beijerinckiaceae bacterium]